MHPVASRVRFLHGSYSAIRHARPLSKPLTAVSFAGAKGFTTPLPQGCNEYDSASVSKKTCLNEAPVSGESVCQHQKRHLNARQNPLPTTIPHSALKPSEVFGVQRASPHEHEYMLQPRTLKNQYPSSRLQNRAHRTVQRP